MPVALALLDYKYLSLWRVKRQAGKREGKESLAYRVDIRNKFTIKIKITSISSVETGVPGYNQLQAKLRDWHFSLTIFLYH
jgi:hypothetical protein